MVSSVPGSPPVIPGFSFVSHLGSGGFADVFLYQELWFDRLVAIKVLSGQLSEEAIVRFTEEANLMARLSNHPSIVTVYRAGVSADHRPFLVMEYCSQPNLDAGYRTGRFGEAEVLSVGVEIAGAVETVHRAGIVHRDIKPANVLTTDYGRRALSDFGIAAALGSGVRGVSVPWAPPEALVPGGVTDERGDVYGLAATLFTLLAGRAPYEVPGVSGSTADLVARIQGLPVPVLDRADVSVPLREVLARAMAKDPAQRFEGALEFGRALQQVQARLTLPQTKLEVREGDGVATRETEGVTQVHNRVVPVVRSSSVPTPAVPESAMTSPAVRVPIAGGPAGSGRGVVADTILKPPGEPTGPAGPAVPSAVGAAPGGRSRRFAIMIACVALLVAALTTTFIWQPWNHGDDSAGAEPGPISTTPTPIKTSAEPTTSASSKQPQPASRTLVNENFSGGELPQGWNPVEGKWRVVNGSLQSTTGDSRARIQFGPMSPKNYRIETTIRFVEVKNDSRWLNIGLDYHIEKDWGAVLVVRSNTKADNGLELAQRKRYAEKFISYPVKNSRISAGVGKKHHLSVDVRGKKVDVSLDREHVFHASNLVRTGGQLGFVINNGTIQFDNVKVIEFP